MQARALILLPVLALAFVAGAPRAAHAQRAPNVSIGISLGVHAPLFPSVYSHGHRARRGPIVPTCAPRAWVPGHYQPVSRDVWVPAITRRVWVAPVIETRCDLWGRHFDVEVAPGHWQDVIEPGHYERRTERVWVPGHWEARH